MVAKNGADYGVITLIDSEFNSICWFVFFVWRMICTVRWTLVLSEISAGIYIYIYLLCRYTFIFF